MDKETIHQMAAEVVARLPDTGYGWYWFLGLQTVLMLLVAGGGAVLGSYLKTRGQNLATKHDFDGLQKRLSETTMLVEGIKSEIGQRDWAQREWTNVRRTKLEALLEKMHECEAYLDRRHHMALAGEIEQPENPISELDALAALYFRELKNEVDRFTLICRKQAILILELGSAIVDVRATTAQEIGYRAALENFRSKSHYQELLAAKNALTTAARSLLERIMNV